MNRPLIKKKSPNTPPPAWTHFPARPRVGHSPTNHSESNNPTHTKGRVSLGISRPEWARKCHPSALGAELPVARGAP